MDSPAANAVLVMLLLTVQVMVGLVLLAYLAYSFFLIVADTAAGNDVVEWPGEAVFDWFPKAWYLFWLFALSMLPAWLVMSLSGISAGHPWYWLILAAFFWLFFPIFSLSSLSGSSKMEVVRLQILRSMAGRPGLTIGFYLTAALLLAGAGAIVFYGFAIGPAFLIPLAAVALSAELLIYARLLGRLAQGISYYRPKKTPKKEKDKPEQWDAVESFDPWEVPEPPSDPDMPAAQLLKPAKKRKKGPPRIVTDPWAPPPPPKWEAPPLDKGQTAYEDPLGPVIGSYGLQASHEPVKLPKQPTPPSFQDDAPESYSVNHPPPLPPALPAPALGRVTLYERALAAPRNIPKPPSWPLTRGVYSFPFYTSSLWALLVLSMCLCAGGAILHLQVILFPF